MRDLCGEFTSHCRVFLSICQRARSVSCSLVRGKIMAASLPPTYYTLSASDLGVRPSKHSDFWLSSCLNSSPLPCEPTVYELKQPVFSFFLPLTITFSHMYPIATDSCILQENRMFPVIVMLMERYSYNYYKNIIYCYYLLTLENPSSNIVLLKSLFAPPSVFISSSIVKK